MAGDEASPSRPSSSASSDLPSLDDLIREQVILSQIKQQQQQQQQQPDGGDDCSNRPTRESSSSSSDVIIISESDFVINNIDSSSANSSSSSSSSMDNSSRRSSTMTGQSISGSVNNDANSSSSNGGDSMDMDMDMDTSVNTNQDDDDGNADDNSPIPRLTSISAAIFVPIPDANKLLQPLNLEANSPVYHLAALDLVTSHEAAVRNNLIALFHRDMFRVRAEIAADVEKNSDSPFDYAAARAHVRARDEDLLRRDCGAMIANMRAPDVAKIKYGVTNIPVADMSVPVTYVPVRSPRECAAAEAMKTIAAAAGDLVAFDRHVRSRRTAIKKQIQDAEAGAGAGTGRMDID
ncbi:hypothetical protein MKX08_004875 [Trichoderma sp. CBMAI-0020]|nr:hypothetical protein MKX08_004875 [Trichoderma sp. CBMAI-0020]